MHQLHTSEVGSETHPIHYSKARNYLHTFYSWRGESRLSLVRRKTLPCLSMPRFKPKQLFP